MLVLVPHSWQVWPWRWKLEVDLLYLRKNGWNHSVESKTHD